MFQLDHEIIFDILNTIKLLFGSNYLDQIIWMELSGWNYLDGIIWIKLLGSIFIAISVSIFMSIFISISHQNYLFIARNTENTEIKQITKKTTAIASQKYQTTRDGTLTPVTGDRPR